MRMLQKIDLDVAMLHMFHAHVASVLSGCCIFIEIFDCGRARLRVGSTLFSVLQMMIFHVADTVL